jgi:hypothetical protein
VLKKINFHAVVAYSVVTPCYRLIWAAGSCLAVHGTSVFMEQEFQDSVTFITRMPYQLFKLCNSKMKLCGWLWILILKDENWSVLGCVTAVTRASKDNSDGTQPNYGTNPVPQFPSILYHLARQWRPLQCWFYLSDSLIFLYIKEDGANIHRFSHVYGDSGSLTLVVMCISGFWVNFWRTKYYVLRDIQTLWKYASTNILHFGP